MNQYNVISPDTNKIYYGANPKLVATKVFRNLNKNNIEQSRICLEDNNTKKKYYFLAMTNNKLNNYENILNSKYTTHIGGGTTIETSIENASTGIATGIEQLNNAIQEINGDQLNDKDFYRKLSELSGNINLSIDELVKILKTKYDPEEEKREDYVTMLGERIYTLDENVKEIKSDVTQIKDKIIPNKNKDGKEKGGLCTIM